MYLPSAVFVILSQIVTLLPLLFTTAPKITFTSLSSSLRNLSKLGVGLARIEAGLSNTLFLNLSNDVLFSVSALANTDTTLEILPSEFVA